ncbi:hypothetical protein HZS_7048, partial [Henneguya salminicola]
MNIFVVPENCTAILGRDGLDIIQPEWRHQVCLVDASLDNIHEWIASYRRASDNESGVMVNYKAEIKLKIEAGPIFMKHRPLSFHKKNLVEETLNEMTNA